MMFSGLKPAMVTPSDRRDEADLEAAQEIEAALRSVGLLPVTG